MNSNLPIEQLWDAYRDGELSQADIARFEQYLADHPDQQALFDVESQWLESLHDQPMMQKTLAAQTQDARLAASTVRWTELRDQR